MAVLVIPMEKAQFFPALLLLQLSLAYVSLISLSWITEVAFAIATLDKEFVITFH